MRLERDCRFKGELIILGMELRQKALALLSLSDPTAKVCGTRQWALGALDTQANYTPLSLLAPLPGRPAKPELVHHVALRQRPIHTLPGRCGLLHAVAHIEFNAINLALDAIWRFAGMPERYYLDWVQVAQEEALHFALLREHLNSLGCDYGDFDAHEGLWQMAERTKGDVLARMALVPRTLEARGLDAAPPMQAKLAKVGDTRAVEILDVILRDEVGHVAIGNHWYAHLCAQRGLEPLAHYAVLAREYEAPRLRAPFNLDARRRAGFTAAELEQLQAQAPARA